MCVRACMFLCLCVWVLLMLLSVLRCLGRTSWAFRAWWLWDLASSVGCWKNRNSDVGLLKGLGMCMELFSVVVRQCWV